MGGEEDKLGELTHKAEIAEQATNSLYCVI